MLFLEKCGEVFRVTQGYDESKNKKTRWRATLRAHHFTQGFVTAIALPLQYAIFERVR
jgi:hypothetical protein